MSARRLRLGAAALGTLLALGVTAGAANAAPASADPANLAKAQKTVTDGIDKRLETLKDLSGRLSDAKDVTAGDRSTLNALLASDTSGLTALRAKVLTETTVAAVRADGKSMIDDYRVYLLVAPKVHLVHVFDAETDAVAKLQKIHDTLADKLAKNAAANTQANRDLLADMESALKAADTAVDGKDAATLALQPGPDGKAISASVHGLHDTAKQIREDLRKAVADAKQVRDALKGSKG
jgi:hypothetical protein